MAMIAEPTNNREGPREPSWRLRRFKDGAPKETTHEGAELLIMLVADNQLQANHLLGSCTLYLSSTRFNLHELSTVNRKRHKHPAFG